MENGFEKQAGVSQVRQKRAHNFKIRPGCPLHYGIESAQEGRSGCRNKVKEKNAEVWRMKQMGKDCSWGGKDKLPWEELCSILIKKNAQQLCRMGGGKKKKKPLRERPQVMTWEINATNGRERFKHQNERVQTCDNGSFLKTFYQS